MNAITDLTDKILEFRDARDWKKYHTPKNLALSLIIELGELFELIQWQTNEEIKNELEKIEEKVGDELADVAIYLFLLAHELGVNLDEVIPKKLEKNWKKYPVGSLSDEKVKWGKGERS